jgi:hypothetical protein
MFRSSMITLLTQSSSGTMVRRHSFKSSRSRDVIAGDAALFAAIPHEEVRLNYWFVFYSERMDMMWIMTSEEFDREAVKKQDRKNVGLRSIWFNGKRKSKSTGAVEEYCKPRWEKYLARISVASPTMPPNPVKGTGLRPAPYVER